MKQLTSTLTDTLEQKVEQQIAFAVKVIQNLPEAELTRPSPSGGWSIVEILDHLNSYGDYYLPLIKSAIEKSSDGQRLYFKSGFLGDYFVKMINPVTGKKKISAAKRHLPKINGSPDQIVSEFIRQEELLLQYVFKAKTADLSAARIPISIAKVIRLKLGDVLLFVINHVDRHLVQISNLPEFPEVYEVKERHPIS